MGIRYVELHQVVAVAMKDLVVVCNGYQVNGAIPSFSKGNRLAGGLMLISGMLSYTKQ